MKKISLLLLAILCVSAVFGQKKEVAVMKPYVMDGATVSSNDKLIMVGAMEEAFTKIDGYKAFSRTSQKLIDAEMVFQRSGSVDDEQIKDVGKQTGVTYICTFTLAIEGNELVIKSNIIDVVTAEIMNSKTVVCLNRLNREDIIEKCESLPYKLLNINQGSSSSNTPSGGNTNKTPSQNTPTKLTVGMSYQGGIIAYIDATGEHGLIAAPNDQSAGIQWCNGNNIVIGTSTVIGTGKSNTTKIVQKQGSGNYAAKLCDDLVLNGYSDWYLPSKDELNILYQNRNLIGGFNTSSYYWSSSELNGSYAWCQGFSNGSQTNYYKYNTYRVRAVRAF